MTLTNTYTVGRAVMIRFGSTWRQGAVISNDGRSVGVMVIGLSISVHYSVVRRDLRVVKGAR